MNSRVLFVDDEPNVLSAIGRHFNRKHETLFAQSGEEALGLLESTGPVDVVVSDLTMPGMGGLKLLARVNELYPETMRIILTGHADLQNALDAVNKCQAFRILSKPCAMEDLDLAITAAIGHAQLLRERGELLVLRKWADGMEGIIQGFTHLVEARDPYTAGHQLMVSRLAAQIAESLQLAQDEVLGVKMAALVHDIGKVYVPSQYLNKPGKLTSLEFAIIKNHAQIGSEILSPISFPWPIGRAVHEHHERLDGSGYPQGLSGGEICIEAKIIMVADVVDAMSSHRPYRPGFPVERALEEIAGGKGKFYEPDVVEACLALFEDAAVFDMFSQNRSFFTGNA